MIDRDALWSMEIFLRVLEEQSLAGAARRLRVTPSALSKHIARLEERLAVRLLHRSTRRLRPTPAGLRYAAHASRLLAELARAEEDVSADNDTPRGELRVSASTLFGQAVIAPIVARFVERFTSVRVDLDLADRYVDMLEEPFDVVIRIADKLPSSNLTGKKIGEQRMILGASPAHLARLGPIERPEDLRGRCLDLAHDTDRGRWRLGRGGKVRVIEIDGPVIANSLLALYRCALAGAGVAQLPTYLVEDDLAAGRLVRVLPGFEPKGRSIYALHASGRMAPARVQRFVAFLEEETRATLKSHRGA